MTAWFRGPLAAFDVESTGVNVETDRIVSGTVIAMRPTKTGTKHTVRVRSHLIAVDVDIPESATAVHGITTEHACTNGKPAAEILDLIAADLAFALTAGIPVVGMNIAYDFTILDRELRRHGLPTLEDRIVGPINPVVDCYVIDKAVDRYRRGSRRLDDLRQHYNVRHDGAHDATQDALAAARVVYRIAQRYPKISRMTLCELHAAQVGWYAEQTRSYGQYLMREANQLREQADQTDDTAARDLLGQDIAILEARIDGLSEAWPLTPHTTTGKKSS